MELPRRLQHTRFDSFGKDHAFGMALQLLYDTADETHGDLSSGEVGVPQLRIPPEASQGWPLRTAPRLVQRADEVDRLRHILRFQHERVCAEGIGLIAHLLRVLSGENYHGQA